MVVSVCEEKEYGTNIRVRVIVYKRDGQLS